MIEPVLRILLWPALLVVWGGLVAAVLTMAPVEDGLSVEVGARLASSGVDNPVTAVLLNFRGYDTLLEVAVLTLAVLGIWSVNVMPRRRAGAPGLVLSFLIRILVPFMVLLGGYLLWAGADSPGGAFQAGVVFAAAGVLVLLSGTPLPRHLEGWPLRTAMALGLVTFLVAGILLLLLEGRFLEYPRLQAKHWILAIEVAAAVSIGIVLAAAIRGGRPGETAP
ncbi:MAG: MnhB domain-containing protein [Pseudomonadota bacterium]